MPDKNFKIPLSSSRIPLLNQPVKKIIITITERPGRPDISVENPYGPFETLLILSDMIRTISIQMIQEVIQKQGMVNAKA